MVTMETMETTTKTITTYNLFHLDGHRVAQEGTHLVIIVVEESPKRTSGLQGARIQAVLTGECFTLFKFQALITDK